MIANKAEDSRKPNKRATNDVIDKRAIETEGNTYFELAGYTSEGWA